MALGEDGFLDDRGNWREIQSEDEHGVAYIHTMSKDEKRESFIVGIIVLACISFLLMCCGICVLASGNKKKDETKTYEAAQPDTERAKANEANGAEEIKEGDAAEE